MKFKIIFIFVLLFLFSCFRKVVVLAEKDATLFSNYPDINFSGKKIISEDLGFQTVKNNKNGRITYPALYLGSGNPDSIKDSFVIGGFNLNNIDPNFKKARLKFFINYSSFTRRNVIIFIRPVKKEWDEERITYSDIYIQKEGEIKLTDMIEQDEKKCKLIIFNVEQTLEKDYYEIPFSHSKKELSLDITSIVREWVKNPISNHGLLIDPLPMSDLRYCTTNESKELSPTGTIEIASSEWFYLENISDFRFLPVKNNAKNKLKYPPRIELYY